MQRDAEDQRRRDAWGRRRDEILKSDKESGVILAEMAKQLIALRSTAAREKEARPIPTAQKESIMRSLMEDMVDESAILIEQRLSVLAQYSRTIREGHGYSNCHFIAFASPDAFRRHCARGIDVSQW